MPSAYQDFVRVQLKKAPSNLSQPEKMKWCGAQWRSRSTGKGITIPAQDKEDSEYLEKTRADLKTKLAQGKQPKVVAIPPKPAKVNKIKVEKQLSVGKGKGLKAPGGRGLVAPGTKTPARSGRGADLFKETSKIAKIASKTGSIQDFLSHQAMGGVTSVRGRKGANLVSLKVHK